MRAFETIVHPGLEQAEASWRSLQAAGPCHVFQTWDWCRVWQRTLGAACGARPCPVEVRDGDGPAMLLPLCVRPEGGHLRLDFMDSGVADYNAPLVRSDALDALTPEAVAALWRDLAARLPRHDVAIVNKMPHVLADGSANPMLALSAAPHAKGSHQAVLGRDWESFQAGRTTAKTRSATRRKRRRLEEWGGREGAGGADGALDARAGLRSAMPVDAAGAEALTGILLDLKGAWHEAQGRTDPLARPGRRGFYLAMARELAPAGVVHVSALYAGTTLLAGHWGAVHGGRFYYLLPAYAPGPWTRHSPGALLMEDLMRWSVERGLDVFDFTLGDEAYKMDWSDAETRLERLVRMRSVSGLPAWGVERLRGALAARPALERLARRVLAQGVLGRGR